MSRIKTVGEMIEYLSAFDEDREILVAVQPNYPIAHVVQAVTDLSEGERHPDDEGDSAFDPDGPIWIACDQVSSSSPHSPYAPRSAWEGV